MSSDYDYSDDDGDYYDDEDMIDGTQDDRESSHILLSFSQPYLPSLSRLRG